MGNDVTAMMAGLNVGADNFSILIRDVQAIFFHDGSDVVAEVNKSVGRHCFDLRVPNLKLAQCIKVDFVDGAAGGNELNVH